MSHYSNDYEDDRKAEAREKLSSLRHLIVRVRGLVTDFEGLLPQRFLDHLDHLEDLDNYATAQIQELK